MWLNVTFIRNNFGDKGFNFLFSSECAHNYWLISRKFLSTHFPVIWTWMRFVKKVVIALLWYINSDIVQRWKNCILATNIMCDYRSGWIPLNLCVMAKRIEKNGPNSRLSWSHSVIQFLQKCVRLRGKPLGSMWAIQTF